MPMALLSRAFFIAISSRLWTRTRQGRDAAACINCWIWPSLRLVCSPSINSQSNPAWDRISLTWGAAMDASVPRSSSPLFNGCLNFSWFV